MEARDTEAIDQLLSLVGKTDLFEYFSVDLEVDTESLDEVLRKRRTWAQGQQSNPKYRHEALWIIKNMAVVRRALIEERPSYIEEVRRRAQRRNREKLALFIEGSMLDGALSPAKEAAIHEQGRQLDLPESVIAELIDEVRRGREQRISAPEPPPSAPFRDYYELLGAPADASLTELEEAYRGRYRWARSLSDTNLSSEVYAQLDEAWRILKDPERRETYDRRRQDYMDQLEAHASGGDREFKGFLPPPPKRRITVDFPPSAAPEPLPPTDATTGNDLDSSVVVLTQDARVVHSEPPIQKGAPPPRGPSTLNRPPSPSSSITAAPIPPDAAATMPASAPTPAPSATDPGIVAARAAAPPPPDGMQTVPTGVPFQPSRKGRAPKLELDGAETHRIRVGDAPVLVRFTVRNTGQGQMSGRVLSDREWVQITPSRLDPLKKEQVVEARIVPRQMPRKQATSLITVVADHGERRSITIDAERRALSTGVLLAAVAVVAMVLAIVVASLLLPS